MNKNTIPENNSKKRKIIALCMAGINSEYQDAIMNFICIHANSLGYSVLIFSAFSDGFRSDNHDVAEMNIYNLINYNIIDGMIILSETIKNQGVLNSIISKARQAKTPVISIDKKIPYCYNIIFNYENVMRNIVEHFVEEHKFTKINFIAGIKGNDFSEERIDAYKKVLLENNIPIEEERIGYGQFWATPTSQVIDDFMKSQLPIPEAIICANDTMAIAACKKLKEYGYQVPEDIKISGFDGIKEEQYHIPRLTTAKQDFKSASILAVNKLKDIFEGKETPLIETIPHQIIISQSCGCVKQEKTDANIVTHSLYVQIDEMRDDELRFIHMAAVLCNTHSISEAIIKMRDYLKEEPYQKIWICAVRGFNVTEHPDLDDQDLNEVYNTISYSYNLSVLIHKDHNSFIDLPDFRTSEILPNLIKIINQPESHNIKFCPMHYQDRTIGYFVINIIPPIYKSSPQYSLVMTLSNALNILKNKTQLSAIVDKLEEMYIRDSLTSLLNRRGFYKNIKRVINQCIQENNQFMVISIDLDGLKYINDVFGHSEGDNAIKTVATALVSISVKNEICARFGGDEFVVAGMIDDKKEIYVKDYLDRFSSFLEYYNNYSQKPYKIKASCGAIINDLKEQTDIDEFIKMADNLMYKEKAEHKKNIISGKIE